MASYRLAAVITNSSSDQFLTTKQSPPPPLPEQHYHQFTDSDLYDLPSTPLNLLEERRVDHQQLIRSSDSIRNNLDLTLFDLPSALNQIVLQVGDGAVGVVDWELLKYVEEAEFGPGPPVHTVFVAGRLESGIYDLRDSVKWISKEISMKLLLEVMPGCQRLGPLIVSGLLHDVHEPGKWKIPRMLHYQEYPPGITIVPMRSRTREPFRTTNLVVLVSDNNASDNNASDNNANVSEGSDYIVSGDALLMDPGCCSQFNSELADLVAALPRKLVVFVTHHHYDHIDGLSIVQKCNPDAILLAHENTMSRIGKGKWSLGCTLISGGEKIRIGGQRLEAISALGHTDGHLALLHVNTNSLIVGDHCVGQGSAVLDIRAGGNMKDYFQTTYKFLELSPHVLIPMHGRINLWPKRMLCGYLKHRRDREMLILKAIESGAETLFDITAKVYADVDTSLWLPASSNVRIHVDHLAHNEQLPKKFSMKKFQSTCGLQFLSRWTLAYMKGKKVSTVKVLTVLGIGALVLSFVVRRR